MQRPTTASRAYRPPESERLTFEAWQQSGLDVHSTMLSGHNGKPTGTQVFVFPNEYEVGRANVGVFNWNGEPSVDVDLSAILRPGQRFKAYNCLDITTTISRAHAVLDQTYPAAPIPFPMKRDTSSPDFEAALVIPIG